MIKPQIAELLRRAADRAQAEGLLPAITVPDITIEQPQNAAHGDYASNLPLRIARSAGMSPMAIGERLVQKLEPAPFIAGVEVARPGFINFTLADAWLAQQVGPILEAGPEFGRVDIGRGARVQVEFGSANPTGPLTVAFGRGGTLGDALASILALASYRTEREYYVNDAGTRMDAFYQSAFARYAQAQSREVEFPADGYHGAYMVELGKSLATEFGDRYLHEADGAQALGRIALDRMVASAREDLDIMGVHYDCWFNEQSLFDSGLVDKVIALLDERGYIDRREGAIWFSSTALGEDKDNVLVRSNGIPTYFASDIAYHYNKFVERGFDRVIDVWGADHQGHVPRMRAAIGALGIDQQRLRVIVHQLITLKRGNEIVRMSKRTGDLITLREVLDEVGPDASRFFFLARSADSQMDFDLELAKKQSNENPVYYVQYAHARIASILEYAGDLDPTGADLSLLRAEPEMALIRKMLAFPELVELMATRLEPHHLPYYCQDLAALFHQFYKQCRVVSEDLELSKARLQLVRAAKVVLANALHLMGINAPEKM
ncbi:MAG: arginine--tRNA ligase [Chloroflexi bacterium]|nr:arginine--tRNA ligase [Chloroflexota bacterium]